METRYQIVWENQSTHNLRSIHFKPNKALFYWKYKVMWTIPGQRIIQMIGPLKLMCTIKKAS